MNKSTKGALAATAAGFLLLGGAGSLAYWSSSDDIDGSVINSGLLTLTPQEDPEACSGWQLQHGSETATDFAAGSDLIVPGDVLTNTCEYTVGATGNNLTAALTVARPHFTDTNQLSSALSDATATATYTVGGGAVSTIGSADNGKAIKVVVSVPFDSTVYGTQAQDLKTTLDDLTVQLKQTS